MKRSGSGGHGNKDAAYVLAGVLVDGAVRFVLVTFLFVAAYAFRNTRLGQSTRAFVWYRSGCAHVANSVRKTKEAFGLVPHRRVNGGRAERKHEAKKLAKQIVKSRESLRQLRDLDHHRLLVSHSYQEGTLTYRDEYVHGLLVYQR